MMPTARQKKEYTLHDMQQQDAAGYARGWREAELRFKAAQEDLAWQRKQLDLEQAKVVTDLMRAAGENLSKAGYLIGKLNKDNSR
jgi:hypothetical protein